MPEIHALHTTRFLSLYDLESGEVPHYFVASRRRAENLIATYDTETLRKVLPDAVTIIPIIYRGETPYLLLAREYRYPIGQFLLSPPAGLIDEEDRQTDHPILTAAERELREEMGLDLVLQHGKCKQVNRMLFSSPGMTDESNALVSAVFHDPEMEKLTQSGACGGEAFDGFVLLNRDEAKGILEAGEDENHITFSAFTWCALAYFLLNT